MGYDPAEVHTGEASSPAQLTVELHEDHRLYIAEDFFGWSAFICSDREQDTDLSGDGVEVGADHDPRAIAELSLSGLGLPIPAAQG
ncbi:hypothetical protein ACFW1M_22325 [Streptomyces inhibens]|uniref:hypothetical protein n=1 Tax=Streptomyces inhibens TaxID=2293571 RepID=UPI003698DBCC